MQTNQIQLQSLLGEWRGVMRTIRHEQQRADEILKELNRLIGGVAATPTVVRTRSRSRSRARNNVIQHPAAAGAQAQTSTRKRGRSRRTAQPAA